MPCYMSMFISIARLPTARRTCSAQPNTHPTPPPTTSRAGAARLRMWDPTTLAAHPYTIA